MNRNKTESPNIW